MPLHSLVECNKGLCFFSLWKLVCGIENGYRFAYSVAEKKENSSNSIVCSSRDCSPQMEILEDPIRK